MSGRSGSPPRTNRRKSLYMSIREAPEAKLPRTTASPTASSKDVNDGMSDSWRRIQEKLGKSYKSIGDAFREEIRDSNQPTYSMDRLSEVLKRSAAAIWPISAYICQEECDLPSTHPLVARAFISGVCGLFLIVWQIRYPGMDNASVHNIANKFLQDPVKSLPQGLVSVDQHIEDWLSQLAMRRSRPSQPSTPTSASRRPVVQAYMSPAKDKGESHVLAEMVVNALSTVDWRSGYSVENVLDVLKKANRYCVQREVSLAYQRAGNAFTQGID